MYANTTPILIKFPHQDRETRYRAQAQKAYTRFAWLGQLLHDLSKLVGRPNTLPVVSEDSVLVGNRRYAGTRTIEIRSINASLGRSADFDRSFRPISSHTFERWLSVATARLQGIALPPVELVQIGSRYAVVDGHHRLSVARAFGQKYIDAEITVWA